VNYIQENRGEGNDLIFIQSNHEGAIVDAIGEAYETDVEGIVINAAAYSHTSIAIMDALKAVAIPTVEVHLTDTSSREEYRHHSYTGEATLETFAGYGFEGYLMAVDYLIAKQKRR